MMFHVLCEKGFCVALKSAAAGLGLPGTLPGVEGADAPTLWAAGQTEPGDQVCGTRCPDHARGGTRIRAAACICRADEPGADQPHAAPARLVDGRGRYAVAVAGYIMDD